MIGNLKYIFFDAFIIKNTSNATKKMSNNIVRYVLIIGIKMKKLRNSIATKLKTNDCDADFLTNSSFFSIAKNNIPVKYSPTYAKIALLLLLICSLL
jgi:hypothetical protein